MTIGLVGRKAGMTRVFTEAGDSVPVTVIEVDPNRVTQVKTADTDGYAAIQITVGERRASRVTKAAAGHFAKANSAAGRGLWEMRNVDGEEVSVGDKLSVERFEVGQKVDVTGSQNVRAFRVVSSGGISPCKMQPTATLSPTVLSVLLDSVKPPVESGKARKWRVIWALNKLLPNH